MAENCDYTAHTPDSNYFIQLLKSAKEASASPPFQNGRMRLFLYKELGISAKIIKNIGDDNWGISHALTVHYYLFKGNQPN